MKRRTEACPECGCRRWSQPESSRRSIGLEATRVAEFRSRHEGIDPRDLPHKYPTNNRCQRCGRPPGKYRLTWDHDHWLVRRGFPLAECSRGWVCRRCFEKMYWLDRNGDDDGSEYMLRLRDRLVVGDENDS
jgi:hypothetical protein